MKTKEYIDKYYLNTVNGASKFNHNDFVADLTIDFMTLLEVGKGTTNIKGYDNAVNAIRMKWNAINNKTVGQLPDKLWNYFYATVIIQYKYDLFPEIMKARDEVREARKREREEYNRSYDSFGFGNAWNSFFQNSFFFSSIFDQIFKAISTPVESFNKLGLTSTATEEEVKVAYRTLSLQHHPDKGGNMDMFIAITEAKNKCMMYLKNKSI